MTQAQFIRRDEHSVQPVIYRWTDGRLYRCSEREWFRMVKQGEVAK